MTSARSVIPFVQSGNLRDAWRLLHWPTPVIGEQKMLSADGEMRRVVAS
jgi:hypothetical protein